MAKIIKTGKTFKVVHSITGVTLATAKTRALAEAKAREIRKRNKR